MKIVILGYIIRGPLGGASWHPFQFVLGLKDLGHDVLFLEDSDFYESCYDPSKDITTTDPSFGISFITELFTRYDLKHNWAYFDEHENKWWGKSKREVIAFCQQADIVLNIANVNPLREWWAKIPIRILLDTDPAFTQLRHLQEDESMDIARHHTHFRSFGENFGKPGCRIPDDGFDWKPTRQPVFLPLWNKENLTPHAPWTTVMQWDSYRVRQFNGQVFGMKSMSFDDYSKLPHLSSEDFQLALGSATAPAKDLSAKGWNIISSLTPTRTPYTYQEYILSSKGEWSIAKHGYVVSNSGWFSERSTCYLASSKPVIVQDTGFSEVIETGKGLFAFSSMEDILESIDRINSDYVYHCKAARKIIEAYFDSRKVLGAIVSEVTNSNSELIRK